MDSDREYRGGGRVPLPGWQEPTAQQTASAAAAAKEKGLRQLRRMSAWSVAALVVGTGAATAAFTHGFTPAAPVACFTGTGSTAAAGTGGGTVGPGGTTAPGTSGPTVNHSVATTSGSGVTVTNTTHTIGGRTIVTHVRRAATYQDN